MLLHRGGKRTMSHDLKLAVLLSFTAGVVNVCGFLSFGYLTTNLTGYLPGFVEQLSNQAWNYAAEFAVLICSFFLGSFFSHFILELQAKYFKKIYFTLVLAIQGGLLFLLAFKGEYLIAQNYKFEMVLALLFLMGLQNSLVTVISSSVVRTTHVTGIFTDLGIDSAKFLFNLHNHSKRSRLVRKIALKVAIVVSFALGGLVCVWCFPKWEIHCLYIASGVVIFASGYDYLKIKMILMLQKSKRTVFKHIAIKVPENDKKNNIL